MLEFSTYLDLCLKHVAESAFSGSQTELSRFHFSENLSVENSKLSAESLLQGVQVLECMLILIVKRRPGISSIKYGSQGSSRPGSNRLCVFTGTL